MNAPDDHRKRTARECLPSATRRNIDSYIRSEVARIHENWLDDAEFTTSAADRAARVDAEAAELTGRVAVAEAAILDDLRADWRAIHGSGLPAARTVAALRGTAREDARHAVLCEHLYPRVSHEMLAERRRAEYAAADRRLNAAVHTDLHRWRRRAVHPTAPTRAIVARTWGTIRSAEFLVLAHALVQTRVEDGLPVPVTPLDPLTEQLTDAIRDQLMADGLLPV
ncbi:hypothetical protein [Nocardia sp. NPDC050718]|uniref:hypothetical protein n=1 Tax=Nocardia sp. NPDC050718 TaxID=3155788 RepID=UPI0033F38DF5